MYNIYNFTSNYTQNKAENVKYITEVAREGIKILSKNIDISLLITYQKYVSSTLSLVSKNLNYNFINMYLQYNLSISSLSPREQVQKTVEFLINIASII